MVKNCYRIVIISKGRSDIITSHKLFPTATVVVPKSEVELYKKKIDNEIVPINDNIHGLGNVRNTILEMFDEECIIMVDDDIYKLIMIGIDNYKYITDADYILQLLENTYVCAKDIGAKLFGYNNFPDYRKTDWLEPFCFNKWVGSVIGIIGRKYKFIDNKLKVDIDYSLQNLLYERIIYIDMRYMFKNVKYSNKGGCSIYRSEEQVKIEKERLKMKWGKYLKWNENKVSEGVSISVRRKQNIIL